MNILCLNVWNGGHLTDEVAAFLSKWASRIDIFCLQEVEESFRELSPILDNFNEFHAKKQTRGDRFDQSIFVRKTLHVEEYGNLLEETDGTGLGQWVTIINGGKKLTVCNFHGMPRPGDKRDTRERIFASEFLMQWGRDTVPCIIMGDFNLRETSESVEMFERNGFRNLIKEFKIETTRNHHVWDQYPNDVLMYSDYAFVSPEVEVVHFEVLPDIVSDHQPLLLEIQ
jgi:endonuclease/exonuclease/phosphatase family metal-dependent hydrolase